MFVAWDRCRCLRARQGCLLTACVWILLCSPAIARAQEPPAQRAPVPRAIILPAAVLAGAPATLAVVDGAGRLLPGIAVEISAGPGTASAVPSLQKIMTDSTGRATFLGPSDASGLTAKISDRRITISATAPVEKESPAPAGPGDDASAINVARYPRVVAILDRFAIEGREFRGAAESNHVFLGDQPCLVVASSPVSLVILPGPHIPLGPMTLRVRAGASETGPLPVTGVLLDFTGPAETPTAGAQGKLILHVRGTAEPLAIEVRNASPEIVQLVRGNVQRLGTSGGEQNIAPVELKFLASGNYVITARVAPIDAPAPHGGN
jgi:hypothetical protein